MYMNEQAYEYKLRSTRELRDFAMEIADDIARGTSTYRIMERALAYAAFEQRERGKTNADSMCAKVALQLLISDKDGMIPAYGINEGVTGQAKHLICAAEMALMALQLPWSASKHRFLSLRRMNTWDCGNGIDIRVGVWHRGNSFVFGTRDMEDPKYCYPVCSVETVLGCTYEALPEFLTMAALSGEVETHQMRSEQLSAIIKSFAGVRPGFADRLLVAMPAGKTGGIRAPSETDNKFWWHYIHQKRIMRGE